jgi:hypothetical protein
MSNIQNAEQLVEAIEGARSNALTILSELEQTNDVRTLRNKVETCDDPHVLFLTVKEVLQMVVSRHSKISKPDGPKQYI